MSEEKRAAGQRREERLAAGKSSREIAAAVKEIDSTFRVYWRTWLAVSRHETEEEARANLEALYEGRVHRDDLRVTEDPESSKPWVATARLWTVNSEWKSEEDAANQRAEMIAQDKRHPGDVEVVARNSRREHVLKQVGKVKMRAEELA